MAALLDADYHDILHINEARLLLRAQTPSNLLI